MLKVPCKIIFDKSREYTEEGYLIAPANFARTGTMEYYGRDIGLLGANEINRKYIVYRDAKALFSKDTMDSFENKPFVNTHKEVDASDWTNKAVGFVRDVRPKGIYLSCNLVICDKGTVDQIDKGKVELSAGYDSEFYTPTEKEFDYSIPEGIDFVCESIKGNHVALVQLGRAGHECRVLDDINGGKGMEEIKKMLEELLKMEREEHATLKSAHDDMKSKHDDLMGKHEALTKEHEGLKGQHEDLKSKHETLSKAFDASDDDDETCDSILDNASVISEAKVLFEKVETKGKKLNDVMLEVVKSKAQDCEKIIAEAFGEKKLTEDGLDSAIIKKAFKAIVADAKVNGMADAFSTAGKKEVQDETKSYGQKCFETLNVHALKTK